MGDADIVLNDLVDEEMARQKAELDQEKSTNNETPSMTRLLDHIAFGSVRNIQNATKDRVSIVPEVASNLVHGITNNIPDIMPDILPDAQKIDKLVVTGTVAAYALTAFGVTGAVYFSMKTVREIGQWRQWYRYRKLLTKTKKV